MLTDIGVEYVIIGHSERRQYFGETDETVNKRVQAALDGGPERRSSASARSWKQREAGHHRRAGRPMQTKIALAGVTADELKHVVIAYEPVWAIGTGQTATAEQANEICGVIREAVRAGSTATRRPTPSPFSTAARMNAEATAEELLAQPDDRRRPDRRRVPESGRLPRSLPPPS